MKMEMAFWNVSEEINNKAPSTPTFPWSWCRHSPSTQRTLTGWWTPSKYSCFHTYPKHPDRPFSAILGCGDWRKHHHDIIWHRVTHLEGGNVDSNHIGRGIKEKINVWTVICAVFLGDSSTHPETFNVEAPINKTEYVGARLLTQAHQQNSLPSVFLCLVQSDYKMKFLQAFEWRHRIRWPQLDALIQTFSQETSRWRVS